MATPEGRAALAERQRADIEKNIKEKEDTDFLAGISPAAARAFKQEVDDMPQHEVDSEFARLLNQPDKTPQDIARMNALGARIKPQTLQNHLNTAVASGALSNDQAKSLANNVLSSPNKAAFQAEDPAAYGKLKTMAEHGTTGWTPLEQSTHADYSAKALADLSQGDLAAVMNRTISATGVGSGVERHVMHERIDKMLTDPRLRAGLDQKKIAMLEKYHARGPGSRRTVS
jgi:hypothetical protein